MKLLLASAALLTVGTQISDVPLMPESWSLYCKGEKANGFNWHNGDWVETRFKPTDYVVMKSPTNECIVDIENENVLRGFNGMHYRSVCLNIRAAGEPYRPVLSSECTESYLKFKDTEEWSLSFFCENTFQNFSGRYDGWFHRTTNIGNTTDKPRNDYKDSMAITVGKCSRVL